MRLGARGTLILTLGLGAGVLCHAASENPHVQRVRPPESLTCSRDHLTSFQGSVLEYQRGKQDLTLRIRTDEDTTERVTLKWEAAQKPETWFLLRGAAFKAEDWKLIETAPGKLRADMRVIAWVCDDGSKSIVDWRPKEVERQTR